MIRRGVAWRDEADEGRDMTRWGLVWLSWVRFGEADTVRPGGVWRDAAGPWRTGHGMARRGRARLGRHSVADEVRRGAARRGAAGRGAA
jgi:hypothetical protein